MLVCDLDYSDYVGRLAIGRVFNGSISRGQDLVCINEAGEVVPLRVTKLQAYDGVSIKEVESVVAGDITILAGIEDVRIGDTVCTKNRPSRLSALRLMSRRCQ